MRVVAFNVGGCLSVYFEFSAKTVLYDIGSSDSFCPVKDFLLPLYRKRKSPKNKNDKFEMDQLIISHPHDDHISSLEIYDKNFYPGLLTVPNDNEGIPEEEKINWGLIKNKKNDYVKYLREQMLPGRRPPLTSSAPYHLSIFYIPAKKCEAEEKDTDLKKENYDNNIGIVGYIDYSNHKLLLAGDLLKDGMEYLIKNNSSFQKKLGQGVDFLIVPHHGLRSGFSTVLFSNMKNGKTKRLNIVSEKPTLEDDVRKVDTRYSSADYCEGQNNLSDGKDLVYQRKTSNGHIYIDCRNEQPKVKIIEKSEDLIKEFL
jgi:hypothetical protein